MSLHKLTAGDGYAYLTRQVAAQDVTHRGYDGLGDYYAQHGESPGRWLGRGAAGLPGFPTDLQVGEAQMVALFGQGRHPDAARIEADLIAAGHAAPTALAATKLGSPYQVRTGPTEFRIELAIRFEGWNASGGLPRDWPIPERERARIRTELGRELFTAEFGRMPLDARELSGFLAVAGRQKSTAVAGYDLTFTPVKSVSAWWAVASASDAELIEACHTQVVAETVGWLEDTAVYSRLGRNGVRQVDVHGLIAAAFVHRDSRAGDPNLHTHVAVSNKVQTLDGQWVALDGRPVHKFAVAASERYNTRLEALLTDRLGVRFTERPGTEPGKRPVREIIGVDDKLARSWSARRSNIDMRRAELAGRFQAEHGRPPGPIEAIKLAQQATLETRQAKHAPRSYAEQRSAWQTEARHVLGGPQALAAMVTAVRHPGQGDRTPTRVTPDWVADTAETVLATVQASRATWQQAHIRAEAERQVRAAELPLGQLDAAVNRVVAAALSPASSLPLGVAEPVSEPAVLRRADGSSVYSRAGMQLFTSAQVVMAERALLAIATQHDARTVSADAVDLAILEATANGMPLNPGQAAMVRELATSGCRLQLALAPAGTGKTTALAALARAWTGDGGTIIGLAPSAAAAAVLAAELNNGGGLRGGGLAVPTDTLAKLLWSLDQLSSQDGEASGQPGPVPGWVQQIGPHTLVVLDEAGMAGTTELARAVAFITGRGGSVRLIGDDQQLAAIGAGGVLRDLAETRGAVTLSQVVRFTDPAEGAASLALRAGDLLAIGFYIDHTRVHVGDASTVTDLAYAGWAADRAAGRDALMLAPTRQVAAALNTQARTDRLAAAAAALDGRIAPSLVGPEVTLADGSRASAGDTVITRRNDRRLAITATDWVKNGDRWTVEAVLDGGALRVTHLGTRRRLTLPAGYVAQHVALGYASTVHAAQGSTTEVCHTVGTGAESRQLLYVAMTRGRSGNHLYLASAGDGDEHSVITPDALLPPTAVDLLSRILRRDGAQTSATTAQRQLADPAGRLAAAADRYADSLTVATETVLGPVRLAQLDRAAELTLPGLTTAPAYPALRAHLAWLAVDGHDPTATLIETLSRRGLDSALDPAAVLLWRMHPPRSDTQAGPLPWLPPIPAGLIADPAWGGYLQGRHSHTRELADRVAAQARGWTPTSAPTWAAPLVHTDPTPERVELLGRLAVWRAANAVDDTDLRFTGAPQLTAADTQAQHALDIMVLRALGDPAAAANRWHCLAEELEPRLLADPCWPQLADRLAAADRAGIDITTLARTAAQLGPLPDELPAAALWWRLSRQLSPAALNARNSDGTGTASTLRPTWTLALAELIGGDDTCQVLAAPAWPALVAAVTDATSNGWSPQQVLATAYGLLGAGRDEQTGSALRPGELATALVWRIAMLTDPDPVHPDPFDNSSPAFPPDPAEQHALPPDDLYNDVEPPDHDADSPPTSWPDGTVPCDREGPIRSEPQAELDQRPEPDQDPSTHQTSSGPTSEPVGQRQSQPLHPSVHQSVRPGGVTNDAVTWLPRGIDQAQLVGQTGLWQPPTVARERLLELNSQALAFFTAGYADSWAAGYLRERLGTDLTDDPRFTPGYALASWTALTDHLQGLGATEMELLAAGLASTARTGRLIDRFRDRLILPIHADAQLVAFIGRRNPRTPDAGPKYLNTNETDLYSKGAQLYGMTEGADELAAGATPVLVEGPLDAIAVTLAAASTAVGVAPLGTAFTDRQADQLRRYLGAGRPGVIVATDADAAGQRAAVRAYWQLTCRGGNPRHLIMADGQDPAGILQTAGPEALREVLVNTPTLARTLINARVAQYTDRMQHVEGPLLAVQSAAEVIGALPPEHWLEHIAYLNTLIQICPGQSHLAVLDAGHAWTHDPDGLTRKHLTERTMPTARGIAKVGIDDVVQTGGAGNVATDLTAVKARATGGPVDGSSGPPATAPDGAGPAAPMEPLRPSRNSAPSPLGRPAGDERTVEQWAADVWVDVGRSIDPRLVAGADWSGLAAALERASRAGYDVQKHLPRLAARGPLPDVRPARALHYRLVEECEAAITPIPQRLRHVAAASQAIAARARLDVEGRRLDNQGGTRPTPTAGADHPSRDRTRQQPPLATPETRRTVPTESRCTRR